MIANDDEMRLEMMMEDKESILLSRRNGNEGEKEGQLSGIFFDLGGDFFFT